MFLIYGRDNCVWCESAKNLITRKGYKYVYKNIETDPNALDAFKRDFPDAKTVPQILCEYNKVGTYNQLVEFIG